MSAYPSTLTLGLPLGTHGTLRIVRDAPKLREDRIRAAAGRAYNRLLASRKAVAAALGVDPSCISQRRRGEGSLAAVLLDVDRAERGGIDTTPLLEAWLSVAMDARAAFAGSREAVTHQLAHAEQIEDGAEDCEQMAWFDRQPGAGARWCAAIDRYLARLLPLRRALASEVER